MRGARIARLTTIGAVLLALSLFSLGSAQAATAKGPLQITGAGVGKLKLGSKYSKVRRLGLVKRMRPGCPLGGPQTRSAALRAPLRGSVELTTKRPRRIRSITIDRGATANGVGVGSALAQIRSAFPTLKVVRGTADVFGLWLAAVPRAAGGQITFAIDVESRRTTSIGIPHIPFCE